MLVSTYMQTLTPKILGETIDILKTTGFDKSLVRHNIVLFVFATLCAFFFAFIWRRIFIGNSRKLECSLREDLYRRMQVLGPSFYGSRKTGDLMAYAVNDISAVRTAFGPAIAIALSSIVTCAYSIYYMAAVISPRLTFLCLLPIPPLVVFVVRTSRKVQTSFRDVQRSLAGISDRVQENLSGMKVLKSYVQESNEIQAFSEINSSARNANIRQTRLSSSVAPAIEICFGASFSLSLLLGYKMILEGHMTMGEFISFNSYLTLMVRPVTIIGRVVNNIQMGTASDKRLNEIFSTVPDISFPKDGFDGAVSGSIELIDVSYRYGRGAAPALDGINLKIAAGQTVGITGRTGSGKSTLSDILMRCCDPASGCVLLDGRDIRAYSETALKSAFCFVPQETFLFSASVRENIAFFKDTYTDNEIAAAAHCSDIYDTVAGFPHGFDTQVGERGGKLSGGQQQRIAIARAVIKNAPILIIDDALSALDAETEAAVLRGLKSARAGKTNIIISHKLSAIAEADRIVVMNKGRIAEEGTKAELLAKRGAFYDICIEQSRQQTASAYFHEERTPNHQGTQQLFEDAP